jgi:hypothetical protein
MRALLTPDDLKKGDLAEIGWHPAEIIDYDEEAASDEAKNPGSTNCNFYFKILDGPSKGITCKRLFNETALGFGKNLWKTLGFPYDPVKGYELTTQLFEQTKGSKLMIYIKRGKSNRGNEFNDVVDFRPMAA